MDPPERVRRYSGEQPRDRTGEVRLRRSDLYEQHQLGEARPAGTELCNPYMNASAMPAENQQHAKLAVAVDTGPPPGGRHGPTRYWGPKRRREFLSFSRVRRRRNGNRRIRSDGSGQVCSTCHRSAVTILRGLTETMIHLRESGVGGNAPFRPPHPGELWSQGEVESMTIRRDRRRPSNFNHDDHEPTHRT